MRWMTKSQSIGVKIRMQLTPAQMKALRQMDAEKRSKSIARWEDDYVRAARQIHKESNSPKVFSDWMKTWQKDNPVYRRPKKGKFVNNHLDSMGWNDD